MAEGTEEHDEQIQKVQSFIRDQVRTYMADMQGEAQRNLEQQQAAWNQQQVSQTPQQQAYAQAGQFIRQFTQPETEAAKFKADDSKDYVDFYMSNPLANEYRDQVEHAFETLRQAGRPTTRTDVLRYLRGREMETDPQGFASREKERQSRALDRASGAGDIGALALARGKADATMFADFDKLTTDEMEKKLEGITF